jgi:hypothetical protein
MKEIIQNQKTIHDSGVAELAISFLKPQQAFYLLSFFNKEGHNHGHDEGIIISRVYSHSELTP